MAIAGLALTTAVSYFFGRRKGKRKATVVRFARR